MPVTGPFSRSETTYWPGNVNRKTYHTYWWYRNGAGPFKPHPFVLVRTYADTPDGDAPNLYAGYYAQDQSPPYWWADNAVDVHNKAYDRFVSNARGGVSSQLGATIAEWGQSQQMIGKRAGQLMRAARALKRGYPYEFFKELGMLHRMPRRLPNRSDPKKAADLWLEWWFGWKPLIGDIHDSIDVLQAPIPISHKVMGKASSGFLTWESWKIRSGYRTLNQMRVNLRELIAGRVTVSNGNLYRATQLGLTNPASILWEIVPFSFVVDWFVPVGAFLNSWTDTLGLTLEDTYTTTSRHYTSLYQYISTWPPGTWSPSPDVKGRGYRVHRTLGYTGPALVLRPYKGISMTRAATAISLLVQQLNRLPWKG